ncbi:MAG: hypothetical protein ACQEXB_21365 [Bacillota bacterium]
MRKVLFFSAMILLLIACTPKAYTENLEAGKNALKEEKYAEAVQALSSAQKEKETDEVNSLLHLAERMNDCLTAFSNGEYEASAFTAKKIAALKAHSELEEEIIRKSVSLLESAEKEIKHKELVQEKIIKGQTLLGENKFDEAYIIFKELLEDKTVLNDNSLMTKLNNLMIDTVDKKKKFLEEEEQKKLAAAKKKQEEEARLKEAEEKKKQEEERKRQEEANKPLTPEQAIELVKQYIDYEPNPNVHFSYDHDNENGDYVIWVYEFVIDDPVTKEGHSATWGWYAVDPVEKYVYNNMNY